MIDNSRNIEAMIQTGIALSSERDIKRLLEIILTEARRVANADAGTCYLMDEDQRFLHFSIVQNDSLNIRMGGTQDKIEWAPIPLFKPDGSPNHSHVSAHVAITGNIVNINDVYHADGFDFEGTRQFDKKTGYRSKSMLVVPMRNHEDDIIGVLQLINAMERNKKMVIPFSKETQRLVEAFASQAAVALTNNCLIKGYQELFDSFIKVLAETIDEKSPYTAGHIRRVAKLTMLIAERINQITDGEFGDITFDKDKMRELEIAAWLHDVGKVVTPSYIMDKSTRLETLHDRIELIELKFSLLKEEIEREMIEKLLTTDDKKEREQIKRMFEGRFKKLQDDLEFIKKINNQTEPLKDSDIERIKEISKLKVEINGTESPILTDDELECLTVRAGTLTARERQIIMDHVKITRKMLSGVPFPKKIKNVPIYAAEHHERVNGTGYPEGLKDKELPLQARIIALADVFEALTAKDRPYKRSNTLSEAIQILKKMVSTKHIDPLLFDIFIKEKIFLKYAKEELDPSQIDDVKI